MSAVSPGGVVRLCTVGGRKEARFSSPRVAEPLVAFIFGSLSEAPRRRGKLLQRELAGHWAARRGDFRIIYRLDDGTRTMYVIKIAHRSDVSSLGSSARRR
ncbi:type II toxin-antitoxin system RelE family toxin [[Mycobacterium] vasticus]|uniref:type II toxin-antitoxin system RelE family toxin n=1 Tax=[Mycobacterium] vasticus TaxID=2875777 RepID=UPI0038B5F7DE